jgi:hypothetical protein
MMRLPIWRRLAIDVAKRAAPAVVPPVPALTATIREVLAGIRKAGPVGLAAPKLYHSLKLSRELSLAQFERLMEALVTGGHVKQVGWQYHLSGVQS